MNKHVEVDPTAQRDLRRMGPGPERRRVMRALADTLEAEPTPANADIKALAGAAPWLRLRVGDWRVIYRPLADEEMVDLKVARGEIAADEGYLVYRVIGRGDLERAVGNLP